MIVRKTSLGIMVTLTINGRQTAQIVGSTDARYLAVEAAASMNDESKMAAALFPPPPEKKLAQCAGITVTKSGVFFGEEKLDGAVVNKIMQEVESGASPDRLLNFLRRLYNNPSRHSREQLYTWISHHNLPITDDGTILSYKSVRNDLYSITAGKEIPTKGRVDESGRIYNGIGEEIRLRRRDVDDNPSSHCSYGLHVGSLEYVRDFGGTNKTIVIVEVDPADIVSVPNDCNCQKVRCEGYKVIGYYDGPLPEVLPSSTFTDWDVDTDDFEVEDEWDDTEGGEDIDMDQRLEAAFDDGWDAAMKHVRDWAAQ